MTSDFEAFLRAAATPETFSSLDGPPPEKEIEAAERRIETSLPDSYKLFLRVLGPGDWCGAGCVEPVEEIEAFQDDQWEMAGFVGLVWNVREVGDHVAFDPADPVTDGERPVYYCAHEHPGYARIADSFEAWVRATSGAAKIGADYYAPFDEAVAAKRLEWQAAQPKKWWQFWR